MRAVVRVVLARQTRAIFDTFRRSSPGFRISKFLIFIKEKLKTQQITFSKSTAISASQFFRSSLSRPFSTEETIMLAKIKGTINILFSKHIFEMENRKLFLLFQNLSTQISIFHISAMD